MARAPFDRTIDLIWGPGWPLAGTVRVAAMPARVVPDLVFREPLPPMGDSLAYATFDQEVAYSPAFVPDGVEQYIWSSLVADRVAIVSGSAPTHYVVRLELRTRLPQPSYWRAHIAPIPTVPLTPCQEAYPDTLAMTEVGGPLVVTLSRVGPTTWVFEDWTVYAEYFGPPDPDYCTSTWRMIKGDHYWDAGWNGQGTGYFDSTVEGDPDYWANLP